ncbi:MAG: hypothetical protein A3F10_06855 [Coxiella sp. RIFCSPHIGHO2_12_FULL_42_15]|nr:MAG: hypothetical protein A3F10_06855 [Coxiella sp. RIFCSPHIGHO2_12_FULL_42_15]
MVLFVWDGLRPDSISKKNTPHLYELKTQGTWFSDNHSSYPTFTMMNAASFATGDLAGKTGFYGNTLWNPRTSGIDAQGNTVNFNAPVFTEDYRILLDLNQPEKNDPLFEVSTLFSIAQAAHLKTATIGKTGAAFIQDYRQKSGMKGINMDERHVYPLEFAQILQKENYPLPILSPIAYKKGELVLTADNGDPTAFGKIATLKAISGNALGLKDDFMYPDNVTSDPTATTVSPYSRANQYLMKTYLNKILPMEHPNLSVIWLRNPDTTEHNYGVGSPSYYTALHDQDELLGQLLQKLKANHSLSQTDIIIASDHSHSNVSGPLSQFPLRYIHNGTVSVLDVNGFSVSGDFRPADLLTRAGFHAYDGLGCQYDPVLSGIKENGELIYPPLFDKEGTVCNEHRGRLYTTPSYKVPHPLPSDAIIVAANGGSTYFYVPSHQRDLIKKLTRYLQSRQEFGAVFVDDRYTQLPGTLPMSLIHIQNKSRRNPDIIAGSSYDNNGTITAITGIEFSTGGINRGMHGSFSRTDVHNTLLAIGPDFKTQFIDPLPSGNIDVAPTIAYLLNLKLPNTDGRPLLEALKNGKSVDDFTVLKLHTKPKEPAMGLQYQLATNPNGKDIDKSKTKYTIDLYSKLLLIDGKTYPYFDAAKEKRY